MASDPMLDDLRAIVERVDPADGFDAGRSIDFIADHGPALLAKLEVMEKAEGEMPAGFGDWFRKNYPGPDTIINRPDWHAPKIWRAAMAHLTRGQS